MEQDKLCRVPFIWSNFLVSHTFIQMIWDDRALFALNREFKNIIIKTFWISFLFFPMR